MRPSRDSLPENAILVARSMGPAALLDYDRNRLRGLVLEESGPNSHVAIVARALGLPAVGKIENATGQVDPGDAVIVDGSSGEIHVRPSPDMGMLVCGTRAAASPAAIAVPSIARAAVRHQRRAEDRIVDQCRSGRRPAAYRGDRRRRDRALPHGIAVHGRGELSPLGRAVLALSSGVGRRRTETRHVSHSRYRGRQDPCLTCAT